jgi:thiamine biosynthesis lipoprotein
MIPIRLSAGTRDPESHPKTGGVACLSAAMLLILTCSPPETPSAAHQISGPTMGTRYTVKVAVDALSVGQQRELQTAVEAALDGVNAKMSHYLEDSEISRLNRWRGPEPFVVSPETLEVLQHAREISSITDGAFDITVGPLVDAWGFGPPGRPAEPPATEEIDRLLRITGWELLEIDRASSSVVKTVPELRLDLSAIAKGFGVDQVADGLDALGVEHYMVEVGGEVRTRGLNSRHEPWQIGIERPLPGEQTIELILPLSGLAMATSGDYRNYYEIGGQRISHTIDPRTGHPLTHNVASVSVVAPLCVRADAYATALLVLGPEGFDLAERLGLAAYFLQRDKGEVFVGRMTKRFRELLGE